jgi:hypothetical protein
MDAVTVNIKAQRKLGICAGTTHDVGRCERVCSPLLFGARAFSALRMQVSGVRSLLYGQLLEYHYRSFSIHSSTVSVPKTNSTLPNLKLNSRCGGMSRKCEA